MKKMFSFLLFVCMVLVLAPIGVDADTVSYKMNMKCEKTQKDPDDSTRSYTDCDILIDITGGSTNTTSAEFTVTYNKPTDKSDFEIKEEVEGLVSSELTKTSDGGKFTFDFNDGKTGSITAFKIRFYADSSLSGKDCGGNLSMKSADGKVTTTTTTNNSNTGNPETGVSAPVIIIGAGLIACLVVYATTSKKTKMHKI